MDIAAILKKNKINKQEQYEHPQTQQYEFPQAQPAKHENLHFYDEEAHRQEEARQEAIRQEEAQKKAQESVDYGMKSAADPKKRVEAIIEEKAASPTDDTIKTLDDLFAVERDIEKLVRDKLKEFSDKGELKFYDNPTTEEEIAEQQKVKAKTADLISSAIVHYTKSPTTKYNFINQEHTKELKKRCLDEIIGFGPITIGA